jgi:hypothetical protein
MSKLLIILGALLNLGGGLMIGMYLIPQATPDISMETRYQYLWLGGIIFLGGFMVDGIGLLMCRRPSNLNSRYP